VRNSGGKATPFAMLTPFSEHHSVPSQGVNESGSTPTVLPESGKKGDDRKAGRGE
jgi:hypothetical protein